MRKVLLAAMVMAIAGCATAPIVSQTIPSERVGTYRLLAVEHQAVPEILSEGPQAGTEILSGQLILNSDGTLEHQRGQVCQHDGRRDAGLE